MASDQVRGIITMGQIFRYKSRATLAVKKPTAQPFTEAKIQYFSHTRPPLKRTNRVHVRILLLSKPF
jgi:hypothetical protein